MNLVRKRGFTLLVFLSFFTSSFAQIDSSYTVELPEGYLLEDWVELSFELPNELVEEVVSLNFDTSMAIGLGQVVFDTDMIPTVTDEQVADRLACLQSEIPLHYNSQVRGFIDYFTVRKRGFTLRVMQRKNLYFPIFERMLAKYNMPQELKYLSIIESALIPSARSRVGAVGLWQFMPYTGKMYGLQQNNYLDERMDPEKATEAACRYLKYLHGLYNDWELAIAAYNCGPGNINKAQRRSGKKHFWDIYEKLPRETRSYLPQFVAMAYALNYAEEHNLIGEKTYYPIPSEEIFVSQSIDFARMAKALNMCQEDLELLNPAYKAGFIPENLTNVPLRIPTARMAYFLANRAAILDSAKMTKPAPTLYASTSKASTSYIIADKPANADKFYYTVKKGDVLGVIADRNKVGLSQLKSWNNLAGNTIYPGQKLVIYAPGKAPATTATAPAPKPTTATATSTPAPKTTTATAKPSVASTAKPATTSAKPASTSSNTYHLIKNGDTLWSISKKYNTTVEKIRQLNKMSSDNLKAGEKIRVK